MASFSVSKAYKFTLAFSVIFLYLAAFMQVSCFQYEVGGEKGWVMPDGSEFETYNEWAQENRFHIGDTLYFKYTKDADTLLQVGRDDYESCVVDDPISVYEDGNTVFEFDRSGYFYFISGKPGHCEAGQKMIVRVMVHSANIAQPPSSVSVPAASPESPGGSGGWNTDSWGPTATNSTDMLSVTSYFLTLFMGVVIVLYLFMD